MYCHPLTPVLEHPTTPSQSLESPGSLVQSRILPVQHQSHRCHHFPNEVCDEPWEPSCCWMFTFLSFFSRSCCFFFTSLSFFLAAWCSNFSFCFLSLSAFFNISFSFLLLFEFLGFPLLILDILNHLHSHQLSNALPQQYAWFSLL